MGEKKKERKKEKNKEKTEQRSWLPGLEELIPIGTYVIGSRQM